MARGVTPAIGVVVLVAVTVTLAATVLVVVETPATQTPPTADFEVSANATTDRITVTHSGGETIEPSTIDISIRVEGESLAYQPPVPFFAAHGFISGPTGPFNSKSTESFRAGISASLRLASTNDPPLSPGDDVTVTITSDQTTLYRQTVTAT